MVFVVFTPPEKGWFDACQYFPFGVVYFQGYVKHPGSTASINSQHDVLGLITSS